VKMNLKDFTPRPMREVEYFGVKISIPAEHEWVATGDDGVVYSYSANPEELNGMWIIPQRRYGAEDVRIGTFTLAGEPGAIETLRHYPKGGEMNNKPEYFVFNAANNEFYEFETEEEALHMAEELLQDMRIIAGAEGTWLADVEGICAGVITHRAFITHEWKEDGKDYCDYGIKKVQCEENNLEDPEPFSLPISTREVEYLGMKISIPEDHEWVATDGNGDIYSYSQKPEYRDDIMVWVGGSADNEFIFIKIVTPPRAIPANSLRKV
jgi:hypothetical protein